MRSTACLLYTSRAVITVSTAGTVRYEPASKRITIDVRPVTPAVKAVSAAKGKVKVTITKVEGATKYQVKYGRNGKYKNRYITHRDNEYVLSLIHISRLIRRNTQKSIFYGRHIER